MRYALIVAFAALAACAEAEQVTEVPEGEIDVNLASPSGTSGIPVDNNAAASEEVSAAAEPLPGQWFTRTGGEGPWAGYGPPNSEAAFSVRCEGERLIFNTTEMPPGGPGPTEMRISAAGVEQTVGAEASEDGLPNTDASVPADAQWLARLESASGNLTVRVGGGDPLAVPISEPLTSLIRDCRR